jgi:hypothetical protein
LWWQAGGGTNKATLFFVSSTTALKGFFIAP